MAIKSTEELLAQYKAGGPLTTGQITGNITPQTYDTSYPIVPSTIDSSMVNPNPPMSFTTPKVADTSHVLSSLDYNSYLNTPTQNPYESTIKNNQKSLVDLMASLGQKTADQQTANEMAGVNDVTSQLNDIAGQIQSLQKQSAALKVQESNIPLQQQQDVLNRGITTTAGLAPLQASDLRKNAIQQNTLTSQALLLSSTGDVLKGKLATAQQKADQAVNLKYAPIEANIEALKQNIANNLPFFNAAEKKQADLMTAKLAERTRLLNNAKEDSKIGVAMANVALKNFPNNPQAQYNAQLAIQESQKENPDLNKIYQLVGQYQNDPASLKTSLLEQELKRSQIAKIYADIALNKDELKLKYAKEAQNTVIDPVTNKPTSELKLNAKTSAKDLLDKFNAGSGTSGIGFGGSIARGVTGLFGGTPVQDFQVQFDNLKSLLSLDNIKLLKGQGAVSDAERRLLSDASAKISVSQSEKEFKSALSEVYIGLGGTLPVSLTDNTGKTASVVIDADGLQKAKSDGLKISY